jgi:DNA polymerase-1
LVGDQLQNAPKTSGYRECIVPRDDKVFVICDFGGMELATIAQVCLWVVGDSQLARLINDGVDLHAWLGAKIAGVPYEKVIQAKTNGGPRNLLDARALGKVGNFSFWGMASAKRIRQQARIQYGVDMTLQQAYALQQTAKSAYPEMPKYHARINAEIVRTGGLIRSVHSDGAGGFCYGDYRGGCSAPEAANGLFQRLGADGSNASLRAVTRECYANPTGVLFGSRPVIFFHDEVVWESPVEIGHECAIAGAKVMEKAFRSHIPDVRSDIEPVLATCWSKKARQVWEKGRLVPWTPKNDV